MVRDEPFPFETLPHERSDIPETVLALEDLLEWLEHQVLPPHIQRAAKAVEKALRENGRRG